ncbi:unnamed protein product [Hymenolepis diminuta]|uniref:Fe2OG dioxygenase domain-containing protein n=1 Tax=Hymenolepis diminuta TaxID=6216 RepID=A0A564YRT5_HYMDI|nr:unnamed protein product [Hymenolepis diminuta]
MFSELSESEVRKWVFRFYKNIADDPVTLDEVDKSLNEFVSKTTLQNSSCEFLKYSFAVQYSFEEEFYLFRSAISDTAVNSFYEDALLDWPLNTETRSNILQEEMTPKLWTSSFQETSHNTKSILDRLRWITLGYHYDWDNKIYPPGCESPFPTRCGQFFSSVASKMLEIVGDNKNLFTGRDYFSNYVPEASIVNYYRKKTNMGFHVDDCEVSKRAPLISVSLGRPAIFLLEASSYIPGNLPHENPGTCTKTIIPILLRHGDIMITGGHSRLAYHAVPRLLSWHQPLNDLPRNFFSNLIEKFKDRFELDCNRKILEDYVYSTRLNINVRQVVEL